MRAIWHGYMLVTLVETKTLPLSTATRDVIRTAMAALNIPWNGKHPAHRFQARISNDGTQAIYEITADLATNTPDTAFARIAAALTIAPEALQTAIRYRFFAPGGTYQQSLREVRAYLQQHTAAWESTDDD
ncbi:MAG: hypothetical protein K8S97_09265 [Anaerolineae bacterium]|nr:hypothetical protein [Anaerolineae bacterium]